MEPERAWAKDSRRGEEGVLEEVVSFRARALWWRVKASSWEM